MSGILATFARSNSGGGGGGGPPPPLVPSQYFQFIILNANSFGDLVGCDNFNAPTFGVLIPDDWGDDPNANSLVILTTGPEATVGTCTLALYGYANAHLRSFEYASINSMSLYPDSVSSFTLFDDVAFTPSIWKWQDGVNGFFYNPLVDLNQYTLELYAHVLEGARSFLIGNSGNDWGFMALNYGTPQTTSLDGIWTVKYNSVENKTRLQGVDSFGSLQERYFGPTITVRHNDIDYVFTSKGSSSEFGSNSAYERTGDTFGMFNNFGAAVSLQYVSNGF